MRLKLQISKRDNGVKNENERLKNEKWVKLNTLLNQFTKVYSGLIRQPIDVWVDIKKRSNNMEEKKVVTMHGNPLTLTGNSVKVGDKAPDFKVIANDLSEVTLSSFKGKVCLIVTVPSLDTSVCDTETRKFNEAATKLDDNVVVLTISMDLPFAQARWCGAAGVKNVQTLSDYNFADFGNKYGVLIEGLRLLARTIFIVDSEGKISYIQIVDELTNEPDYDAVLEALKGL